MNVMVVGLGWVGWVVVASLSHAGHSVIGVDVDHKKIDDFRQTCIFV